MDYEFIKKESGLPFVELDLNFPYETIMEEILKIPSNMFTLHRPDMSKKWLQFIIFGKKYNNTRGVWNNNSTYTTEGLKFMPKTVEWFDRFYPSNSFVGIKLALLGPGGKIDKHRDGPEDRWIIGKSSTVNIAVNNPIGAEFHIANTVIPFKPGSCMFINFSKDHYLINESNENRYHFLVGHNDETEEFKQLVIEGFKKYENNISK